MGNEVGAIFLQPDFHGKAMMDKAQELRCDLEVQVFKSNSIGRKYYLQYGFKKIEEKIHEPAGQQVLRLKLTGNKIKQAGRANVRTFIRRYVSYTACLTAV